MKAAMPLLTQPAFRQALTPGAWGHAPHAQAVVLAGSSLTVEILPGLAGGISSLSWCGDGKPVSILQAGSSLERGRAAGIFNDGLACRPLVKAGPASGCLAGTGCDSFDLVAATELHPWRIEHAGRHAVTLAMTHHGQHPYRLTQTFSLDEATLSIRLELVNTGRRVQSLGLGLSCNVARDNATWLAAAAAGLWCQVDEYTTLRHVTAPPAWRFGLAYPLPAAHIKHAFSDWSGVARVHWPQRRLALTLSGDTNGYVLSTPPEADYFGFHPLDCAPDAKMRGLRPESGAQRLAPGEAWVRQFALRVEGSGRH